VTTEVTEVTDELADMASYLGMCVRNALEDFHVEHLSDAQMAILNPIVRNAIVTGLVAAGDPGVRASIWAAFQADLVPDYWERPELLPEYLAWLRAERTDSD